MDGTMAILVQQMKIIATLMAIGFIEKKLKLINDTLIDSLSAIIAKLILPLMLLTIIGSLSLSQLAASGRIFIATAIVYSASVFFINFLSRFSKLEEPNKSMHVLLQCYGNSGYIGIPLIVSIFPEKAGIVAAAFTIVDSFFYWVIAPSIAGKEKINFRRFISPITISVLAGIIILLMGLDLNNNIVWDTMKNVGGTCKYFASIYIGMCIGRMGLKSIKANLHSITAAPIRLLVIPVIAYFIVSKTNLLSGDSLTMFIILCATPSGMSLPIVANIAGADSTEYASVGIVFSTILCLFSIPILIWFIGML